MAGGALSQQDGGTLDCGTATVAVPSEQSSYRGGILPLPGVLGLTGEGIDLLVWETEIPLFTHEAFDNASLVIEFNSENSPSNHATAVIGSVIGQGNCAFHPTAPRATVHAFDNALSPDGWSIRLAQWETMLDAGIGHITNWSFLSGGHSVKTDIETVTHAHPEHLLVLGSGNPSHAKWNSATNDHKNGLSVGSVNHDLTLSSGNSGRGPSDEGRIKPDLVDFGSQVVLPGMDANGEGGLRIMQGSSFACILTAGKAALIQQAANDLLGHTLRGDALKAILLMTAQDLGPKGPDFQFGFGRMQTDVGVEFIHRLHDGCPSAGIHVGHLQPGESDTLLVTYSGVHPFQACLTWMDPAIGGQNHSVLNDLNLRFENDGGDDVLPWAMPEAQTFLDNLYDLSLLDSLTAVRQVNHIDNVELIEIDGLEGNAHRLVVQHNGASDQSYALTWQEVLPQPWTLPSTSETALSCAASQGDIEVFSEHGVMVSEACGHALGHGAYFIQQRQDDGCHMMRTFEVDCDQCPGDVNGDGIVGSSDLMALLALSGNANAYCNASCTATNLAGSLLVNIDDLLIFLGVFGSTCQ
ncbi:MAG: S8 family serine peptidase [Bacteroidota bacterium]|nr:S8 family serine peptidase [Bacteroidota bacterium]